MLSVSTVIQIIMIVLSTFILEDAATLIVATKAQDQTLHLSTALSGLYIGIILGDIGLYYLGFFAYRWPFLQKYLKNFHKTPQRHWLAQHLFRVVFFARFLPGTRFPLYTTCGFLQLRLRPFIVAVVLATLIWTSFFFALCYKIGHVMSYYLGAWRWLGILGFLISTLLIMRFLSSKTSKP